jgi:hypothetical protein
MPPSMKRATKKATPSAPNKPNKKKISPQDAPTYSARKTKDPGERKIKLAPHRFSSQNLISQLQSARGRPENRAK